MKTNRWTGLNNKHKFVIFYRKANGKRWFNSGKTYSEKKNAYADIKQMPNKNYFYQIRELR